MNGIGGYRTLLTLMACWLDAPAPISCIDLVVKTVCGMELIVIVKVGCWKD